LLYRRLGRPALFLYLVGDPFGALVVRQTSGSGAGNPLPDPSARQLFNVVCEVVAMVVETNLTELTVVVIACFVSNNRLAPDELPKLISAIYAALRDIDAGRVGPESREKPAVPIEESVVHDYLICLNDGRKLRALKLSIGAQYWL
jgi:hypothetical protein